LALAEMTEIHNNLGGGDRKITICLAAHRNWVVVVVAVWSKGTRQQEQHL
jgi:hypothetical protein